ncbi:hypothetical protein GCM10027445_27750 [Amycolatopsis endophytica]|uniref:Uncharacterized protein n=1 Tax=Amycolatopsis endophytica TaxID=860233 RepID=A0A853B563_9PSEU|nr:hypothetical protein [Amycolatopsis endophytica]NYI90348.1 hypothetical protein [Amycolatopsis endophytica]
MALLGFALATGLLAVVALVTYEDYLGWRPPEYANVFIGVTFAALVTGWLLKHTTWRSFGTGLLAASVFGLVTIAVIGTMIGIGIAESFN